MMMIQNPQRKTILEEAKKTEKKLEHMREIIAKDKNLTLLVRLLREFIF